LRCGFDLPEKTKQLHALEQESTADCFWSDAAVASAHMRRLTEVREVVDLWNSLGRRIDDATTLLELAAEENDTAIVDEMSAETDALERELGRREFDLRFSGPYDGRSAILAIYAGAGGTESQDWAEMLTRMYVRWAERNGFGAEVLDSSAGEEAGLKSVSLEISGRNVYGNLRSEHGVHRLVRLSPFDSAHRRHTSFANVEVLPEVEGLNEVVIAPDDVRMDVFRSSGAGGQNVQKTSTAVRLTHIPTGIVVTCQNERSQIQNRETAMKILMARLTATEAQKREAEQAELRGDRVDAGWGNQIRSYVLHPYRMVKDHRTEMETSNTDAVLDGDLTTFIDAYLAQRIGKN